MVGMISFFCIGLEPSVYLLLSLDKSLEVSCLMDECLTDNVCVSVCQVSSCVSIPYIPYM